jgi:hypothetical protein
MTGISVLALTIMLKNPIFEPRRCDDSRFAIGLSLPQKRTLHPYGDTIVKIQRVSSSDEVIGYVYTTADGERFFGARPVRNPVASSLPALFGHFYRSQRSAVLNGSVVLEIVPGDPRLARYRTTPCVAADLRGHV